jgi:hypothetical protein
MILAVWLLFGVPAHATTLLGMDIDQVAGGAELVFEGRVIAVIPQEDTAGTISTYVTFEIVDVLKGDYDGATVELKFLGGTVNGRMTEVSGLRLPGLGEQGIYFVESLTTDMVNPLLGWSQGHYLIQTDEAGTRRVTTSERAPVVAVQPMAQVPAAIRKPQTLVQEDGAAAAGVATEESPLLIERALTVDEFKTRIRALLESQAP